MDKETIARHLGVDSGQIVSARPEPGEEGLRVLVDYGIGGIKVFHVPPAEALNPEPAKASSPSQEPAAVAVSDKPAADKSAARKSGAAPKVVGRQIGKVRKR